MSVVGPRVDALERMAIRALSSGKGRCKTTRDNLALLRYVEADFAGDCSSPVLVEFHARPDTRNTRKLVLPSEGKPMRVDAYVQCRKCENCLRRKAAHWRLRALSEGSYASRTWFGTLTFSPDSLHRHLLKVRADMHRQGLDYDALDVSDRFRQLERETGREVTLYLKRVRKEAQAPFRYLLVVEKHKSGMPHYHALLHESDPDQPVRKAVLQSQWRAGFSAFKLAEDKRALTYLTKYLTKEFLARVRASRNYGSPVEKGEATRSPLKFNGAGRIITEGSG